MSQEYRAVSVGNWMLTMVLMGIPIINIILLFVWAFGSNTEISKANWAKAALVWMLLGFIIWFVVFFAFGVGAALLSAAGA
jgi:hypothetical protein